MNTIYKDTIAKSFISLAKTKSIKKITVNEIIKECGISRQTFYNHFKDKYAIVEYLHNSILSFFMQNDELDYDVKTLVTNIFEECYKNKEFYASIINYTGQNSFEEVCIKKCKEFHFFYLTKKYGKEILTPEVESYIDFYCNGAVFILINWIRHGMNEKPEVIAERVYNSSPEKLHKLLQGEMFCGDN